MGLISVALQRISFARLILSRPSRCHPRRVRNWRDSKPPSAATRRGFVHAHPVSAARFAVAFRVLRARVLREEMSCAATMLPVVALLPRGSAAAGHAGAGCYRHLPRMNAGQVLPARRSALAPNGELAAHLPCHADHPYDRTSFANSDFFRCR